MSFYVDERLSEGWTGGGDREAGSWQGDAVEFPPRLAAAYGAGDRLPVQLQGNAAAKDGTAELWEYLSITAGGHQPRVFTSAQRQAAETRPVNVALPVCIYLGIPA